MVLSLAALQGARAQDSTATLHYKGHHAAADRLRRGSKFVWRQRNITADIGSSYSAIPFSGTTNGNMTEARLTGRQSRIGLLASGNAGKTKVTGYWESDFLTVGTTSNSNESNSYALRIRQFFLSAAHGQRLDDLRRPDVVAGDAEQGRDEAPRSEAVPLTIEAQYAVGFNWARQAGLRFVNKLSDEATFGVALEESQTTFSARNAPANVRHRPGRRLAAQRRPRPTRPTTRRTSSPSSRSTRRGWGHWEIKAVGSSFRDRIVDPTNANGGSRNVDELRLRRRLRRVRADDVGRP